MDAAAEEALIDRVKRHDLEAFGRIVDAYQARIYGFVRRMLKNEEEAQDVAQEVFIRAYQALHRFDGRSSLRTWLFRIAANLCIDRARRTERQGQSVSLTQGESGEDEMELSDSRWSPEEIILNDELVSIVEASIEAMSEKLRSVLILHDKEGLAYEEIADVLKVPVGTVKSRLFLARAHVQKSVRIYWNLEKVEA
jgi:RNA polymerase sigma-70 factor (ECF subfamily)